jgi:hypothetical protein
VQRVIFAGHGKNHALQHAGHRKKRTGRMGRLIVDGNMVYEIDEECLKKRKPPRECGVQREIEKIRREEKPPKQHM